MSNNGEILHSFTGDLEFIIKNEIDPRPEFTGMPYVTDSSFSGINLDVGFDLNQRSVEEFINNYSDILSPDQIIACGRCFGVYGETAKCLLRADNNLNSIRIDYNDALRVFPVVAERVWDCVVKRWDTILYATPAVHTAIFDLVYSRSTDNKHLGVLDMSLLTEDWISVGRLIKKMQQRGTPNFIKTRRKFSGELIIREDCSDDSWKEEFRDKYNKEKSAFLSEVR